jgi:hypothetical protein
MEQKERDDEIPAAEAQSAHSMEPAEGAREPGRDARETRPPHPVEPAEGAREPMIERMADESEEDRNSGAAGG